MATQVSFVVDNEYPFTLIHTEKNLWTLYFGESSGYSPPCGWFYWDIRTQKISEATQSTHIGNIIPSLFERCICEGELILSTHYQAIDKFQRESHPFFLPLEKTRTLLKQEKSLSKVHRQILENQQVLMEFLGRKRERRKS